ncbi:IS3 family transposase [Streptomyces chartreusis]
MKTRRWDFVSAHAETFGVQRICRVLQVSRSGYCRWLAGAKAREKRQAAEDELVAEICEIHTEHKGTHGVRRVHAELRRFGRTVNRKRIERLMRRHGIEGRHLRRRKRSTVPNRLAPPRGPVPSGGMAEETAEARQMWLEKTPAGYGSPATPPVIAWGVNARADLLCWVTDEQDPGRWPVAVWSRGDLAWSVHDCGGLEYLVHVGGRRRRTTLRARPGGSTPPGGRHRPGYGRTQSVRGHVRSLMARAEAGRLTA